MDKFTMDELVHDWNDLVTQATQKATICYCITSYNQYNIFEHEYNVYVALFDHILIIHQEINRFAVLRASPVEQVVLKWGLAVSFSGEKHICKARMQRLENMNKHQYLIQPMQKSIYFYNYPYVDKCICRCIATLLCVQWKSNMDDRFPSSKGLATKTYLVVINYFHHQFV